MYTQCRAGAPSLTFGASRKRQGPGHDVQHHAVAHEERNHTVALAVSEEEGGDCEAQKQSGQHRIHESAHRLGERRDQVEEDDFFVSKHSTSPDLSKREINV